MSNSSYHNTYIEDKENQVYYCCPKHRWVAQIKYKGISCYDTKEAAELALIEMILR